MLICCNIGVTILTVLEQGGRELCVCKSAFTHVLFAAEKIKYIVFHVVFMWLISCKGASKVSWKTFTCEYVLAAKPKGLQKKKKKWLYPTLYPTFLRFKKVYSFLIGMKQKTFMVNTWKMRKPCFQKGYS